MAVHNADGVLLFTRNVAFRPCAGGKGTSMTSSVAAVSGVTRYAVRSADMARYALDQVVIPALERIEQKLPDTGPVE